jgi:hypothetical protein
MSFLAALPAIAEAVGVGAAETAAVGGAAAAGGAEAAAVGAAGTAEAGAVGAGRAGLMGRTANFRRGMMAEKAVDGDDSKDTNVAPSEQYDINKVTKG